MSSGIPNGPVLQYVTTIPPGRISTQWYPPWVEMASSSTRIAILQIPFALLELIVSDLAPGIARLENFQGSLFG